MSRWRQWPLTLMVHDTRRTGDGGHLESTTVACAYRNANEVSVNEFEYLLEVWISDVRNVGEGVLLSFAVGKECQAPRRD